ncbi:MAG: DUF5615 family PIN-like protein [Ignavibacteriae bacterium]|nr:DUF5615 family PIN-like protein [Ignavibacteriota bacterium]
MKLLIDANISWRIAKILAPVFEIIHIDKTNLHQPATDNQIWNYAKINDMIIVTNDEDFLNLSLLYGFPPKIILLRLGNQKTQIIADTITRHLSSILTLSNTENTGVLEILIKI